MGDDLWRSEISVANTEVGKMCFQALLPQHPPASMTLHIRVRRKIGGTSFPRDVHPLTQHQLLIYRASPQTTGVPTVGCQPHWGGGESCSQVSCVLYGVGLVITTTAHHKLMGNLFS